MSAVLVHAAVFGVGAVVGAGVASTIMDKRRAVTVVPSAPPPVVVQQPIGGIPAKGALLPVPTRELAIGAAADVLKFGNPGPVVDLLSRKAYAAGYDRRLRHPTWTAEHLTAASLGRGPAAPSDEEGGGGKTKGDRSKSAFMEDESIPLPFRARLQDYFRSGYDRGHMVPAADAKASQEGMNETFLLSNIAPQVGAGFNRHYWAYLEDWCRRLTGSFSDVYVFTVPLYLPRQDSDGKWRVTHEVIGNPPNIAVPTHFAKVVLTSKPSSPSKPDVVDVSMGAFVLPNAIIPDEAPLESFVVPVDAVERAAGLTFFSDALKASSKPICQTTSCQLIIRKFDEAGKLISESPGGGKKRK
ncbi:hypothetical protein DL93DRAFT_2157954 [Clavulina sp. PMI_390]|nr:hypothetical protein DL93DRAFT_2157954 [Clavulina sp. PMI_390]